MCLILLAYTTHPLYPLIIATNRDEFYDRPTAQASFNEENPDMLAGRDLEKGGTWLGITKAGQIAAITNFRDLQSYNSNAPSRGLLVSRFLSGGESPSEYIQNITQSSARYNGFNLILGNGNGLFCFSNEDHLLREIAPGIHGLSNHLLDTPWPKVERGKELLRGLLSHAENLSPDEIFTMLADTSRPDDSDLPDTGIGLEWERLLSSIFIQSEVYGTRTSSVIFIDRENSVSYVERTFLSGPDNYEEVTFRFRMNPGLF